MNRLIFLSFPFLFSIVIALLPNSPWFSYVDKFIMIVLAVVFLFFLVLTYKFQKTLSNSLSEFESFFNRYRVIFLISLFILMLVFPFRNLDWGDGIILLETNLLETKLFGSQIAMDEILETVIHSFMFRFLSFIEFSNDNRYAYQLISYLSGAIFIALVGWRLNKNENKNSDLLAGFVFLSSSGFLIYFGYSENYSVVSLFFLVFIYFVRRWILVEKSNSFILIGATLLVTLGIFFHLVSGFLVFALFYLWIEFSPKEKRIKYLLLCSAIGGSILLFGFGYLSFLHDPTLDRKSSHLLHPPIYPWKRLISINHFLEIFSVLWYNSKIPVMLLGYMFIFERKDLNSFFTKKENRFVLSVSVSLLINGFIINPMLGFPADWDMIGFYWIPLAYLGYLLLLEYPQLKIFFVGLILFSFISLIFQAKELSKLEPKKEKEIHLIQNIVYKYVNENESTIQSFSKTERKFYAKTDFFFFKSINITERMCEFAGKQNLKEDLKKLQVEFREGSHSSKLNDPNWIKMFLTKATITNTVYIKSLKEYNLCRLEP